MRRLALLAALLALAAPARALEECHEDAADLTLTDPETGHVLHYVVLETCGGVPKSCAIIYDETNHVPGLQRCDERHEDNCAWSWRCFPDRQTLLF